MRHPRRHEVFRDVGSTVHHLADRDFVHVGEVAFPSGAALLMCSDGLTDLVPLDAIRKAVHAGTGDPGRVVSTLVDAANDAGGKDNVTVVYVENGRFAGAASTSADVTVPRRLQPAKWRTARAGVVALLVLAVGLGGWWAWNQGWRLTPPRSGPMAIPFAGAIVVRSDESIMAAIALAEPGATVVVEPGEYRERLTLKDNIRVMSRVPRGVTLRLPVDATPQDAAVVAVGIVGAELSGFRIVGDELSPLGVGVITRDAGVRFVDLEVSGAGVAGLDLGAGNDVVLVGSDIHDNAGAGLLVGAGATPRIAHSTFARNATGPGTTLPLVIAPGARPILIRNVLDGIEPDVLPGLDPSDRPAFSRDNWFSGSRPRPQTARGATAAPGSR
jgi:hypothetical protein